MHRRSMGGIALVLALVSPAAAERVHASHDHPAADEAAALAPERWRTGAGVGDDRSGDVRPEAAQILDALAAADAPLTVGEVTGTDRVEQRRASQRVAIIGAGGAPAGDTVIAFETPATIRIWRRGLDGSTASCSGRVDVIPFEQYVRGVLPHEWIRSWDEESLKAGAVAIRTYAAAWVASGGKYTCADLDDTTASQVYRDEFFAVTDAAVAATDGVYIVRGADLVFAEYSAENGDPTAFEVAEPQCAGRAVNGHGRGTCQWGTQRWALAGQTWEWMLPHYYPGAMLVGAGPAWGAALGAQDFRTTLTAGDEMVVWVEYGNDGRTAWTRDQVFVGTTGPRDRDSAFFKAENWLSASRPSAVDQAAVGPGEVGRFTWAMVAPEVTVATTYAESFALVTAGGEWFGPGDDAVTWTITVVPRDGSDPDDPDDPADPDDPDPTGDIGGGCSAGAAGGDGGRGCVLGLGLLLAVLRSRRSRRLAAPPAALLALVVASCSPDAGGSAPRRDDPVGGDSELAAIFDDVARERGVPAPVLAAAAYTQTRLAMIVPDDDGHGHGPAAWGLFALTDHAGPARDVGRGAALAGVAPALARTDARATTEVAAALLLDAAAAAGGRPRTLAGWHAALAAFAGGGDAGRGYAVDVLGHVARGLAGRDDAGRRLVVSARPEAAVAADGGGLGSVTQALGFPGAIWNPAYAGNYAAGSRGAAQINYVVIHTVQGSYSGCISWFKNASAQVSAHYVVRSSDGEVTQMVDDSDVAWHDACFNSASVGIEHEGYVADPERWYTESMYTRSAELTAWLADSYGIAKDREHIYGHGDAPDCSDHTDPGSGWDWAHYMDLVRTGGAPQFDASYVAAEHPTQMTSGEEAVAYVELRNDSSVTWSIDDTRLGTQEPMDRESAFYVDGNWLAANRATGADHSSYGPGAVGRFTFAIRAPEVTEPTTYHEAFQLLQEGVAWFGPIVTMDITVIPRDGTPPDPDPDPGNDPDPTNDPEGGLATAGCSAGGSAGAGGAVLATCVIVLVVAPGRRRRRGQASVLAED